MHTVLVTGLNAMVLAFTNNKAFALPVQPAKPTIPTDDIAGAMNSKLHPRKGNNDGSDAANAKEVTIDCTNFPENCEQDCYAILCQNKSPIL